MSAKLQACGLAAEHIAALSGFGGLLETIEHLIETNIPRAIALIQDVLPFIPPGSKLAIALTAILAIIKPA